MTLDHAIVLATAAHATQTDKAGRPYIDHPLRVMARLSDPDARIAAVLHDVVEDTDWTLERLRAEGFSEAVLAGLEAVTKREREGESYEDFVRRAAAHPIGRLVKRADLQDNLDPTRIAHPTDHDRARFEKYRRALAILDALESKESPGEVS
jgi:(p)ppGpp synthase/HD superfamily hydrolase